MRPYLLRQLLRTTQEIGVNVRLCYGNNAQPLTRRGRYVPVYITLWVKHNGFASPLATNQVGVLRKFRVINLSKEHWRNLLCV
jgi:hypothetical protein